MEDPWAQLVTCPCCHINHMARPGDACEGCDDDDLCTAWNTAHCVTQPGVDDSPDNPCTGCDGRDCE